MNPFKGHGVSSDTTDHTIDEPNSNEHYVGLVNVCRKKKFLINFQ